MAVFPPRRCRLTSQHVSRVSHHPGAEARVVSVAALHWYLCGVKPTAPFVGRPCFPAWGLSWACAVSSEEGVRAGSWGIGPVTEVPAGPAAAHPADSARPARAPQNPGAAREPGVSADASRGLGTGGRAPPLGGRLWAHVFGDRLELADTSCKQAGRHVLGRGQWRGARGTGGAGLTSGTSWHRAGRSSRRAEALGPAAAPPGQLPGRPPWALQLRRGGREATTQMLSPGLHPAALGMSHLLDRSSIWGFKELGTCALGPLTTAGHALSWAASKPSRGPALPLQL